MSAAENKRLVEEAFEALGRGDGRPWLDLLADDFSFTITGKTPWSRTIHGKDAVRRELYGPLFEKFEGPYASQLIGLVAEGDTVVVEYAGHVTTKKGEVYANEYCLICRLRDGKLTSVREYADSLLVERVIGAPPWAMATA